MPACLTHYTFAVENLPAEERRYRGAVALGTQGPDPYFYYGFLPHHSGPDKKQIQAVGEALHHSEVGDHYWALMQYANASEDKDLLYAYIDGLWMHYCVDRNFHPYIFSQSGFDENGQLSGFYKFSHGCYEAVLDCFVAHAHHTFKKTSSTVRLPKKQAQKISRMWAALAPTFPAIKEDSFYKCYRAFRGVEATLWTGFLPWKRPLFRLLGKHSLAYGMSYPRRYMRFEPWDCLNKQRRLWKDPCTLQEHHDGIEDLFAKAQEDYAQVHALLTRAKAGEDVHHELVCFVNCLDHDGSPYGIKKTWFDPCWDKYAKGY